jgi:sugar phosphate isomerase/epimerase
MRLGGPTFLKNPTPDQWVTEHARLGYSAAYAPAKTWDDAKPFVEAATRAKLPIAEVGAWSNPIASDPAERAKAIQLCCDRLALADRIGDICCVNIAGSRGPVWDGPDSRNLSHETFDLIVQTVRQIIDTVQPKRAVYSLETMPWVFPDSPDSYLELRRAIDRKAFGVHLDIANMINCPSRAYRTADFIRECFAKLGPYLKSVHAKDVRFATDRHMTLHLDECLIGQGLIDYGVFLREIAKLPRDLPVMLEHLPSAEQYDEAAAQLRRVAHENNVEIV